MLTNINELKDFIREVIKEEWWSESYDKNLLDDESFGESSVYVPDDIKDSIRKWAKSMGLYNKRLGYYLECNNTYVLGEFNAIEAR